VRCRNLKNEEAMACVGLQSHRRGKREREKRSGTSMIAIWRKIVQQLRPLILHIKKKLAK